MERAWCFRINNQTTAVTLVVIVFPSPFLLSLELAMPEIHFPFCSGSWLWCELKVVCNSTFNGLQAKTLSGPAFLGRWLKLMHWMRWVVGQVNSLFFSIDISFSAHQEERQSSSRFHMGNCWFSIILSSWAGQFALVLLNQYRDRWCEHNMSGGLNEGFKGKFVGGRDARLSNRHFVWQAAFREMASVLLTCRVLL